MESVVPTEHHRLLDRLVGEWLYVSSSGMQDYDPEDPEKRWTETVTSLGGLWVVGESRGRMPDGSRGTMSITLGYDPRRGHYVGTFIGSTMDTLWIYRGWFEDDNRTLVLEAEGPAFDDPARTDLYRDVIGFNADGTRSFSASVRQADGSFHTFMTSILKRIG